MLSDTNSNIQICYGSDMRILSLRLLAYSILLLLAVAAIGNFGYTSPNNVLAQPSPAPGSNFLTYDNPTHKLKLQYPPDWTVSTNALPTYSGVVAFYSPLQNLQDILPAELSLSVTTYLQPISLDEYTQTTLAALEQQGIQVSESNPFTIAGKPGHRIVFSPPEPRGQETQDAPQVSINIMQTWTTIGNKVYLLSYSAEDSKYQKYLPTVEQMLKSLQIQQ
jgi:eukaryotic-like serine/threonine-protein kinase